MVKCNDCLKEVDYTIDGLCYDCNQRAKEVNAELIYPLKTIALLEEILKELKSIKNVLGYLK